MTSDPMTAPALNLDATADGPRCEWMRVGSMWESACGQTFYFDGAEGPKDCGWSHCPYCGKPLVEDDDDD